MTHGQERSTDHQTRPSTSAGAPPRHAAATPAKSKPASPEDAQETDPPRVAKLSQHKHNKSATKEQQPATIDGLLLVTAALRADERQLHAQLLVASEKGSHRAVYLLLHQHLIDRDRCRGLRGYSPLHHAATRGHLEVLQLLLEFGWDVDARNDALETALHLASFGGYERVAECLLSRGADPDARTKDLETPLFFAARKGHDRIVRLLVRQECDLTARNRFGDVAEDEAADDKTRSEFEAANEDFARIRRASRSEQRAVDERALSQQTRERVLAFLDVRSLCRASQVAFRWHRAADNPALWKALGVSRWELQLHSAMGLGPSSLGTLGMLTARRCGVKASSTTPSERPTSCDQAGSRWFLMPRRIQTKQRLARDDARPRTASIV